MREQTELEKAMAVSVCICELCTYYECRMDGNNSSVIKTVAEPPVCKLCCVNGVMANFRLADRFKAVNDDE